MRVDQHYEPTYRREVVAPLLESIKKGYCHTVVSVRGMGLGPLFKFLRLHPVIKELVSPDNFEFSLINFDEVSPLNQKQFLKEFLRDLRSILVTNAVQKNQYIEVEYARGIASEDEHEVLYSIKNLLQVSMEADIRIVVLLQEFDEVARRNNTLLNTLFTLHQLFDHHLLYIFGVHTFPNRLRTGDPTKFDYIFQQYIVQKPFSLEGFLGHYKNHFAEDGLHLDDSQLKLIHSYTGGFASYNRFLSPSLSNASLDTLEESLKEQIPSPQMALRSRQLLIDLTIDEVQALHALCLGHKVPESRLKTLKELGLVIDKNGLFSPIFREHLRAESQIGTGLRIDTEAKKVFIDDVELSLFLSPIEFKFLAYLYEHKNTVCDREKVIEFAWGGHPDGVSDEAVDQLVSRLRSKLLAQTGRGDLITTVRGHGFTLNQS